MDSASRMAPSASRAISSAPSLVSSKPSCPAMYSTRLAISSGPMRVKSYRWQRDRMVAGTFWISVVAKMKITWAGGSSSVFSSALNAAVESMCTSSMIYTLYWHALGV